MRIMSKDFNELQNLHPDELREKMKESRLELIKLKGQARMASSQQDVSKIRNLKKLIARINHLLKNKTEGIKRK